MRTISCVALLVAMAGCASGASTGTTGQQIIPDTMEQICIPAAMQKVSPLTNVMLSRVGKQYARSGPMKWRSTPQFTEMEVTPEGCLLSYYGGYHNEIRGDLLAQAERGGFKVLYSGPNATGLTVRDVLCTDRPDGGSVGIIMSTSKATPDGQIPMVMISTLHQADSCAAFAEKSVVAIPRLGAPSNP